MVTKVNNVNNVNNEVTVGGINSHATPAATNFRGRTVTSIQKEINEAKGCKLFCITMAVALLATIALCSIPVLVMRGGVSSIPFFIVGGFDIVLLTVALIMHRWQNLLKKDLADLEQGKSIPDVRYAL